VQRRVQPVSARRTQERRQFGGGPGPGDGAGLALVAGVGGMGDVAVDELAADGQIEAGPHDHVDLVDGLGGEAGAVSAAGRGELVVEAVEVVGAKPPERHVADGGVDVVVDHPRVAVRGGRSNVASLGGQPGVGEELAEMDRSTPPRC
jgi:hypothetical protein